MCLPSKPQVRPARPYFSSGPCPKRLGWDAAKVAEKAFLSRSHRATEPKNQLKSVIEKIKTLLEIPADYRVGIVPASDTGAVEMALWSLLGSHPVDVLVWESFGAGWASDITGQLALEDVQVIKSDYGQLPDLSLVRDEADVVFTWNGTTSGARVPNADWLTADREGLVICDATSAAFAQELEWDKLDVTTFSWQKAMGGEGAHGILVLSPKAVARLESFEAPRPLPKIFRLTKNGKLIEGIFAGATINTPSMLAVADALDALEWMESLGGLPATIARAEKNFAALQDWVDQTDWVQNLVAEPDYRSNTSVCLEIVEPRIAAMPSDEQKSFAKSMASLLESEAVAFDIGGYRDAPPGLRIWCGATVETDDIRNLTPWLDWAFAQTLSQL